MNFLIEYGEKMKQFRIPQRIPKPPTSTNKSIRFPNEIIEEVENAIRGRGRTAPSPPSSLRPPAWLWKTCGNNRNPNNNVQLTKGSAGVLPALPFCFLF